MKREKATGLIRDVLGRLDAGQHDRPLTMLTELGVFGSYARGAVDPGDVDLVAEFRPDRDYASGMVTAQVQGRSPDGPVRRLLIGNTRNCQLFFNMTAHFDGVVTLWRRGDTLAESLARLSAIDVDPTAGRAPRDSMHPAFEGLDRWIPRWAREAAFAAVESGAVTIERVELSGTTIRDRAVAQQLASRWNPASPLLKAAVAVVADWEARGIDPTNSHLHGHDVRDRQTPYFAGFGFRYWHAVPRCLGRWDNAEWLEVVRPGQRLPLQALRVTTCDRDMLSTLKWG